MEARLFIISIWCLVYGQILRFAFRREALVERRPVVAILDGLFWGTAAAMAGMLYASYMAADRMDETTRVSLMFAVAGFVGGLIAGYTRSDTPARRDDMLRDNLDWADTGFSAILLAAFVMFFIVQAFKIPSASMRETFIEGDHLFVNKFVYGVPVPFTEHKVLGNRTLTVGGISASTRIERRDIVIFRFPAKDKYSEHYGKDFIKRAIALPGQTVRVVDKKLIVDGETMVEPYKQHVDKVTYPGVDGMSPEVYQHTWETGGFATANDEIRDNFGPVTVPPGHIFVMGDNRDRSFDSRFWGPLRISAVKGKAWLRYLPFKRIGFVK